MTKSPKLFARTWRAGALLIVLIVLYFLTVKYGDRLGLSNDLDIVKHLVLTLIAVIGVHLLERAWLWKDIAEWNKNSLEQVLQESEKLVSSAAECGLKRMYSSRLDVKTDILEGITNAKNTIWLLGVGLSAKINLEDDLLPLLKAKYRRQGSSKLEVRILLLDALSGTAVFRTFVESPADEVKSMMDTDSGDDMSMPAGELYFRQRLYRDFEHTVSAFNQLHDFRASVRFYTHTPSCWLVITDDTAYFEPYTFGSVSESDDEDFTIGHLLPVFRFDREENRVPFQILRDHFEKLWLTSNKDLFHIGALLDDRRRVIRDIFKAHKEWFGYLYGVLCHPSMPPVDRRLYPRRPCESSIRVNFVRLDTGGKPNSVQAGIVNFSRAGLCLEVRASDLNLNVGERLEISVAGNLDNRAAIHFKNALINPTRGVFKIIYLTGKTGSWIIGAAPSSEKKAS